MVLRINPLSPVICPFSESVKKTDRNFKKVTLADVQLKPALDEIKISPLSPQQQTKLSEKVKIDNKSMLVFKLSGIQLFPESVVFSILPFEPAVYPVCALINLTERKESLTLLLCTNHPD